ncbi:MAG: SUMF1/EgtB/PvdO family nonheme iron enzyme [Gammaproteobacteria bacterium]|nr:SUMF1/EgtB/PvdO family nonheme iron enzyme [Gammaproteobacteria bacterium]
MFHMLLKNSFIILFISSIILSHHAYAKQNKIALVIGNSNYKDTPLRNPVNDAQDIANELKKYGFVVQKLIDADLKQMKKAIHRFGRKISQENSVGLFFFAGHGLQIKNVNYLVPINANIASEADVEFEAVDANRILSQMSQAENGLNLMILDACRNNPYSGSFRSSSRGLAKMHAPTGSVILYATSPGTVAADGSGNNGLFTEKLLDSMREDNLKIEDVFKRTAIEVSNSSDKKQVPYFEGVILGDFYFNKKENKNHNQVAIAEKSIARQPPQENLEVSFWNTVKESPDYIEGYRSYLKNYPNGYYKNIAELKIAQLENEKTPETNSIKRTVQKYKAREPLGLEFVHIRAGCFKMGSLDGEDEELPVHEACITQDYKLSKYEVTQAQWKSIMGDNPSKFKKGDNYPVEQISWFEAQTFVKRLNQLYGGGYRLPTEAEWEYACRNQGKDREYCGTKNESSDLSIKWDTGHRQVGMQQANDIGLYDMDSNVREWVFDWFDKSYYSKSPNQNPKGAVKDELKSVRGGSWMSVHELNKAHSRFRARPDSKYFFIGLRLAKDV